MSAQSPARGPSLYNAVLSKLSPEAAERFTNLFAQLIAKGGDGNNYRVGIRAMEAWKAETGISRAEIDDLLRVIEGVLERTGLGGLSPPDCCPQHEDFCRSFLSHPALYPDNSEFIHELGRLLWAVLPHCRGVYPMNLEPRLKQVMVSRLIPLRYFLSAHHVEVLSNEMSLAAAIAEFSDVFCPARPRDERRADVRAYVTRGVLQGMIGARPAPHPGDATRSPYCNECRPFGTPARDVPRTSRAKLPPDEQLRRVGLAGEPGDRYLEILFRASIPVPKKSSRDSATVPTVLDAQGYWLFRPDRCPDRRRRLVWNHSRHVGSNGRGVRELTAGPTPVRRVVDLIAWSLPTGSVWPSGAAAALSSDIRERP